MFLVLQIQEEVAVTDILVEEKNLTGPSEKDLQELRAVSAGALGLIIVSLALVWPYGWMPLLYTLGFTTLGFAFFMYVHMDTGGRLTKESAFTSMAVSLTLVPALVLLCICASKWGEPWSIGTGILGLCVGIAFVVRLFRLSGTYSDSKKMVQTWISLMVTTLVLVLLTAAFVPQGVLLFTNGSVTYTTGPRFALPWVHEHPMERPALWGNVTLIPSEPQGWKADIAYSVLDPYALRSDDWLRYRTLQSSPYVFQAFHDTQNPAEAVRHEFVTYYPFLEARVTVVRTVTTTWESSATE